MQTKLAEIGLLRSPLLSLIALQNGIRDRLVHFWRFSLVGLWMCRGFPKKRWKDPPQDTFEGLLFDSEHEPKVEDWMF